VREQMVHQCVSENLWFKGMLGIDVDAPPVPQPETRLEFIRRYAQDSARRLAILGEKAEEWWEGDTRFFDVARSRAWVMTRRIAHTSHHRGQLMAMLRMLGRDLHSNYGPTADTGGLMQNHAPTIYVYEDIGSLLAGEAEDGEKTPLSGPGDGPVTERQGNELEEDRSHSRAEARRRREENRIWPGGSAPACPHRQVCARRMMYVRTSGGSTGLQPGEPTFAIVLAFRPGVVQRRVAIPSLQLPDYPIAQLPDSFSASLRAIVSIYCEQSFATLVTANWTAPLRSAVVARSKGEVTM